MAIRPARKNALSTRPVYLPLVPSKALAGVAAGAREAGGGPQADRATAVLYTDLASAQDVNLQEIVGVLDAAAVEERGDFFASVLVAMSGTVRREAVAAAVWLAFSSPVRSPTKAILDRRYQVDLRAYLFVESREVAGHVHDPVGVATTGRRQRKTLRRLRRGVALAIAREAVVRLHGIDEVTKHLRHELEAVLGRGAAPERVGGDDHAAVLVDLAAEVPEAGQPRPAPGARQAEDQHVALVRVDLAATEDKEPVFIAQRRDLRRVPHLVVLGQGDAVEPAALRVLDEVRRVQMAVARAPARMVMEVDEHPAVYSRPCGSRTGRSPPPASAPPCSP